MTAIKDFTKQLFTRSLTPHKRDAPVLKVQDLSISYNGRSVLDNISFTLITNERVAVVGPNGAGKSTLFKVIAGLLQPDSGDVRIFGQKPGGHICIAYIPQRSQIDWSFPVTVNDVVMMGRVGKIGMFKIPSQNDWDIVRQSIQLAGIDHLNNRQIGNLSGGEQQRMFIARALAQEAELMLMDEPLNGLDLHTQREIYSILDELRDHGVMVLLSTHDLDQASEQFDKVILLNRKLIDIGNPAEVFTTDKLMNAYSRQLTIIKDGEEVLAITDDCCDEDEV